MPEDVDTLFPADQKQDVDSLFPPEIEKQNYRQSQGASPVQDLIFGDTSVNPIARVLDAFGQGAKQNWGNSTPGISDDTANYLKKAGIFNDYDKGQQSIVKAANEALIRGAATAVGTALRVPGMVLGGTQGAVAQIGEEAGAPQLGREIAALPEAFPTGTEFAGIPHPPSLPAPLAQARSLGIIGEGEAGWKGTVERVPQAAGESAADAQAVKATAEAHEPLPGQPESETAAPVAAQAEPPAPDIHAVARQIAPQTFQEYDALASRQDTFRRWIDELRETRDQDAQANAPHADEIEELQNKIPDATPRLAKKYQARLDPLIEERDAFIADQTSRDSSDMTKIRDQLMQTDYRMRDLAPDVSKAYRDAAQQMPETVNAGAEPAEQGPAAPVQESAEAAPAPAEAAPQAQGAQPVPAEDRQPIAPGEAQAGQPQAVKQLPLTASPSIVSDVRQKLVAAGRPTEEADAAANLVSAYWQTRAERFEGRKGTADEMYAAEGPEIKAGKGKAQKELELAQGKQGRIRLRDDGHSTITLLKNADASTFIHETGHEWLDRMLRDAKDEQAPEDLKTDAGTVLKWLGADSAEDLKTRHHEKFARGFETYMMEGRAPTQALASVFAKFKDWLTRIYNVVIALKAPISDDIRDVFDRLLTRNPERAVVAPETEPPRNFADEHEAKAEAAPPDHADHVGDIVQQERDSVGGKSLVEGNDARLADTGAEASRSTPRGEEPPGDANAPGPAGGETGVAPESGAVGAGRSEIAPEGNRARDSEKPVAPSDRIPRSETHLIDKAGNIRLDNLGTPEDVSAVIRQAAEQLSPYNPAITRGVVSDAQVLDLADALGMDAAKLSKRNLGEAFNAEQIMAARKLLVQSATNVRDLAGKVADGTDADVVAYAEAEARHLMIQEQVSGITAEAGRALRAFRSIAGMKQAKEIGAAIQDTTGRTLYQIRNAARKVAQLDTLEQISQFVQESQKKGLFDWVQSTFINALISGPFTHAGYTAAGELFGLFRAVGETSASAAVGKFRELTGLGEAEYANIREAPTQLYGMYRGGRNGIKAAWKAIKSNQVELPPEVTAFLDQDTPKLPLEQTGQSVNPRQVIPNPTIGGRTIPIGTIIEAPGRLVAALHSFNWTTFYSQSVAGQAFRTAMREKLEGQAFADRIAELTQRPTDAMIEEGITEANGGALMQRPAYDSLMGQVSRLTNWGVKVPDLPLPGGHSLPMGTLRPLKYIDPFVQIQANIQKTGLGRGTPLALFSKSVRDDLSMKNGGVAFDRAAGRMISGTSFMMAAGGLAAEGLLNHSGPSDPKQSREWQRIHGMPHGLQIGEFSYDVLRLGNLGLQMSVAADLYHAAAHIGTDDATSVASDLVHAFAQNIVDESSMRGPAELMQAIDEHDRYGAAYVRNFVSSLVPFSVGLSQIARQFDPYSRQARTTMDAIKAKIPFVSEELMPRRDVWGEPIENRGWLGTYNQRVKADPVDQALYDLGIYPALPERRIRGVQLTDQQYDDYSRIAGRTAKMRLNAIVGMPGFNQIPAEARHDMITKAVEGARDMARSVVMMQSESTPGVPGIITQAKDAKLAKLRQPETVH